MPNQVAFADNSALARNKQPPLRITRRVRNAIDAMVEQGLDLKAAAEHGGMSTYRFRLALEKPHVNAYYRNQCQVFRASTTARNIHRLCEIRDAENNMPAVNAIKTLMGIETEQTNNKQTLASPGVTIRIVNIATPTQHELAKSLPIIELDANNADVSTPNNRLENGSDE
jgi:hypothetical protein